MDCGLRRNDIVDKLCHSPSCSCKDVETDFGFWPVRSPIFDFRQNDYVLRGYII